MTLEHARDICAKIEFLHFRFRVEPFRVFHGGGESSEIAFLVIEVDAPDTRDRSKNITVIHRGMFDPLVFDDKFSFVDFVFDRIAKCLRHEAAELFKVGGIDVFNEHSTYSEYETNKALIKTMFSL